MPIYYEANILNDNITNKIEKNLKFIFSELDITIWIMENARLKNSVIG